jgi:hypothetical protein
VIKVMYQRTEDGSADKAEKFELPPLDVHQAIELLQSWSSDDPQEQRDTWDQLKKTLDEGRLSDRKLFP